MEKKTKSKLSTSPKVSEETFTPMAKNLPHATSTPVANGVCETNAPTNLSGIDSGSGSEDETDDEDYNTDQDQDQDQHDNRSLERKTEVNFGRFYNKSYLSNSDKGYLKRSSQNLQEKKSLTPSFIKPEKFSYSHEKPEFLKAKKGSGMMALASGKRVVRVHHKPSVADLKNEEAVKLSMYPAGKPREANEPEKIERDDWPGPASPAALLPEILRERRRSRGEEDGEEDEENQKALDNPKIKRELEEMTKLKDKSGIGSVIYKELEERKALPIQALNPWKSSRVPSAKYEPRYCTRYQSPMFASPSRFLDYSRRSWDDSDIRGYRSLTTLANLPIPKPGYGPSYGLSPRATTLPLSGVYGARVDYQILDYEHDQERQDLQNSTDSGIRNEGRVQGFVEGPSISVLKLQKSTWHTEAEPRMYEYDRLKVTNFILPKDVDRNMLEIHLNDEDFDNLFKMPRDKFYKLAEWKRNDIKKKLDLY
ncbi:uncharacterized protein LOC126816708 isoform X2 [Patella vulgata]|nr:uncharacterized protein LOC126816708 isoform X2 [Patella vulgata]XP_055955870.1 uncharacterized protein LOC126816708 isoform X2 [Patella vulgata]